MALRRGVAVVVLVVVVVMLAVADRLTVITIIITVGGDASVNASHPRRRTFASLSRARGTITGGDPVFDLMIPSVC